MTRIVFMGSPDFARPTLKALADNYQVVGVVAQRDRPAGRGRQLTPPPVKELALELGLPVYQPTSLRKAEALEQLHVWAPDVIVTAASGFILTAEALALPSQGTLNVHASLLPRWRGAAPIQAAILAGDAETGITIMMTDEGLDTGPILSQRAISIGPQDTATTLHERLARLGADLLLDTLPRWLSGELKPRPQSETDVTLAPPIDKQDGLIDWSWPAAHIDRQVRAYTPWPSAYTFWTGRRLVVRGATPLPAQHVSGQPGLVVTIHGHIAVVTGEGLLRLDQVQLASKKAMSADAFARGHSGFVGSQLTHRPEDL